MNYCAAITLATVLAASTSLVQAESTTAATGTATTTTTTTNTTAPAATDTTAPAAATSTTTDSAAPAAAASTDTTATATAQPVDITILTATTVTDFIDVMEGWSAKKSLLDKKIVNEKGDKVGEVQDLIVAPDTYVSYAIVDVGGFLGMGEHRIAVPVKFFQITGEHIVLNGATKDLLKQVPQFKYSK